MAEGLSTLDGQELTLDQAEAAFAAAMAAPPADQPGLPAPERKPPEPPADPVNAPHGWTWVDSQWRPKKAPGRPRNTDKPRVTHTPVTGKADKPKNTATKTEPTVADFRKPLQETLQSLWFAMAVTPVPEQMFGLKMDGIRTKVRAQAAIIEDNANGLVNGLNTIGQHNRFVASALNKLSAGEGGLWVLPAVMMIAPFVASSGQLWSGKLDENVEALAARTEASAQAFLEQMTQTAPAS